MSNKARFSTTEWQMIADGPEWVFTALAAADGNVALTVKAKEASTFKKVVSDYSTRSGLVKEVIADNIKPAKEIKNATLSDAEQALEEINDILAAKVDRVVADGYRNFLNDVAESVAEGAGEGLFGAGKKLSDKEAKALTKIKSALKSKPSKVDAPAKPMKKPTAKPAKKASVPSKKPAAASRPSSQDRAGRMSGRGSVAATPAKEYMAEHKVKDDDTLSGISLKYYGSAIKDKWMIIYEENKAIIGDNPNVIRPGQVLKIPKLD